MQTDVKLVKFKHKLIMSTDTKKYQDTRKYK